MPHLPLLLLESCSTLKQAFQIHAQFILNGLHHHTFPLSRLVSFFALSHFKSSLHHSRQIFSQIDHPNLFMYNTMIRAYSRSSSPEESLILYNLMNGRALVSPNNYTFPFLVGACSRLLSMDTGQQVHAHIIKFGVISDVFIANSLIHFYCSFWEVGLARQLFVDISERDMVSFNAMISGLARHGRPGEALCIFRDMRALGLNPDEVTIVSLLSACSVLKDSKAGKLVHVLIYRSVNVGDMNILVKNALLDMYAKCGLMTAADLVFRKMQADKSSVAWSSMIMGYARCGEMERARKLFDDIPKKDLISWTTMLSIYTQTGRYMEALELYKEMEKEEVEPDEMTMTAILSAAAQLGAFDCGEKLHQYIKMKSFAHNPVLYTAIVYMYAKCGSIDNALDVFNGVPLKSKSVSLFNSIISGLSQHGLGKKALEVFGEMKSLDLKPDKITFVGLLCACSHGNLVAEGKKLFSSMQEEFGIEPEIEHYGCMVDLLGRCGLLKEAYDFIEKMPFKANSIIWGALLSACKIYDNVEMAMVVGQRILQVEPGHGGRYVLLSNMCANARQWEDAQLLRKEMDAIGIQKPAGWSSIELNGSLHQFLAGDVSSSQVKEIDLVLAEMSRRLKSVGYMPNTSQVSFDIDDEEKEIVVSRHSEKLAFAYGLLNLPNNETMRIMKNLRICRDCHSSFKVFSKSFEREIVVRDRIRFHHFKNGFCSCGDYW